MIKRLPQGSVVWFEMVGAEIVKAAAQIGLPCHLRLSVIERYVDGAEIGGGFRQGLRIDVADGKIAIRTGVPDDDVADVVIEVTAKTARRLNLLRSKEAAYLDALEAATARGNIRINGDLGPLESVFQRAHDRIVERTR